MNAPNPAPLDLSLYVTAPRLSVPAAVALGISLLAVTPRPAPQPVRRAALRLRSVVLELQQEWRRQVAVGLGGSASLRDVDTRVDRAFRALSMRLEALGILPPAAGPDVEMARAAHQRLFAEGMRFLNLPYAQQWAHCDRILATLEDDQTLAADVDRIVGETVLAEARAAQLAYGEGLGITTSKESAETVSLVAPLDAVRSAIVSYGLQIVAMQADDPARLPAARKALAPIDQLRADQARRIGSSEATASVEDGEAAVTPDTPVPAIEDEPAAVA